jgi:hypothetical protein
MLKRGAWYDLASVTKQIAGKAVKKKRLGAVSKFYFWKCFMSKIERGAGAINNVQSLQCGIAAQLPAWVIFIIWRLKAAKYLLEVRASRFQSAQRRLLKPSNLRKARAI